MSDVEGDDAPVAAAAEVAPAAPPTGGTMDVMTALQVRRILFVWMEGVRRSNMMNNEYSLTEFVYEDTSTEISETLLHGLWFYQLDYSS